MSNFFDKGLHFLGKNEKNVFVLNIGAMDGVLFDEMIGYTNMYNFKGLYVEPIPYLFEKLKNNLGDDNKFENCAISDYDGEIEMMTIDKNAIDSGLLHNCFYGMSAVYPPKNGLGSEFDKPTVDKYGSIVKVNCKTFESVLNKHNIHTFDVVKIDAEGHDYKIFKQIDLNKYKPKVIRLEWINLDKSEQNLIVEKFNQFNYKFEITGQDIVALDNNFYNNIFSSEKSSISENINNIKDNNKKNITNKKITLVTGLWDLGRSNLSDGWSRSYEHYLSKFEQLLQVDCNMIIYGDNELQSFVLKHRKSDNTQFIVRNLNWFRQNEYFDKIQNIRKNPVWYNQVGWLSESTQAKLEMYNPLVMSKMFLLHDAKIMDRFDSDYMFWIDAGITNTVHPGYFTHDKVLDKITTYLNNFNFICFPYETNSEIHGFKYDSMLKFSGVEKINKVARGGFFGGLKSKITEANNIYYGLLLDTLNNGFMGTEESIFTIMTYKNPELFYYFEIEGNGLLSTFFENLKNDTLELKSESKLQTNKNLDISKVALYVITFNSPNQFEVLIQSMLDYDRDFIDKPKKFLLDNSTDLSTTTKYRELCELYGFEHIKKDNLGIVGGRIFVADHFEETGLDFYYWFEDDMAFYPKKGEVCRNGFNRYVNNLYEKTLEIITKENFDFLKLNFSEFFGDNSTQWSWYNVPQEFRKTNWPEKPNLPVHGLDPDAPRTLFKNIKTHKELPYASGEIYICNWPILLTKEGNYKCYLETKWAHPFEQTLMSHCFQETIKGKINPGILLLTPTEHNRFEHYDGRLRKES
jgi:FkbM family methyltransferase